MSPHPRVENPPSPADVAAVTARLRELLRLHPGHQHARLLLGEIEESGTVSRTTARWVEREIAWQAVTLELVERETAWQTVMQRWLRGQDSMGPHFRVDASNPIPTVPHHERVAALDDETVEAAVREPRPLPGCGAVHDPSRPLSGLSWEEWQRRSAVVLEEAGRGRPRCTHHAAAETCDLCEVVESPLGQGSCEAPIHVAGADACPCLTCDLARTLAAERHRRRPHPEPRCSTCGGAVVWVSGDGARCTTCDLARTLGRPRR